MKKKLLLTGICLTLVTSMALAGCGNPSGNRAKALSSSKNVYGIGAVSSVRLLGSS